MGEDRPEDLVGGQLVHAEGREQGGLGDVEGGRFCLGHGVYFYLDLSISALICGYLRLILVSHH
jgi:hypothetical protein